MINNTKLLKESSINKMNLNKQELRKYYLALRKNQDNKQKQLKDDAIFLNTINYLIKHQEYKKIGIYYSNIDEVDTLKIIEWLIKNRYEVYLNKIIDRQNRLMQFGKIYDLSFEKEKIYKNIIQPKNNEYINKNELDIILIPVVAYDNNCNRIGMGYGYYDNYLKDTCAIKIGLAYKLQKTDHIHKEPHDVKLDLIINEDGIR